MAKPTQEELRRRIKNLESEMLGGFVPPSQYVDLLGAPKFSQDAFYLKGSLPPGVSYGGGKKQTILDELTDLQLELEKEDAKRTGGMTPEYSKQRRQELYDINYQDYIKPALSSAYGGMKEKTKAAPKVFGIQIPQAPSMSEKPEEEPGFLTAMSVQSKSAMEDEMDWAGYRKRLVEVEKKNPREAQELVNETKAMLGAYMDINPNQKPIEAYENLMKELDAIDKAPKIKRTDIAGFEKEADRTAFEDAFGRQITQEDMPQDLTPLQMELAKKNILINQEKVFNEVKKKGIDQKIDVVTITIDPTIGTTVEIPLSVYQVIKSSNPKLPTYKPFIDSKTDNLIRDGWKSGSRKAKISDISKNTNTILDLHAKADAINRAGNKDAWYLNPQAKKVVLENPEDYILEGFFERQSPFGDVAETGGAYGFRMLMSPLNIIAGTAQEYVLEPAVVGGMGIVAETGEAVGLLPEADYFDPFRMSRARGRIRAKEMPLYADKPILANVAGNKGHMVEAQELAKAYNLEGWEKVAVVGGGLLTDIASPDVGIIAATSKMIKTTTGLNKLKQAQKVMFGTNPELIKDALRAGSTTFMNDLNGVSAILSKTKAGKRIKEAGYGTVASHLSDTTAEAMKTQRAVKDAYGGSQILDAVKTLPEKHPYRVAVESAGSIEDMKAVDALAIAKQADPENVKLVKEWEDTQLALKDLSAGKTLDDLPPFARVNRDIIDAVSINKFGKKFEQLTSLERLESLSDSARVIDSNYAKAIVFNTLGPKQLTGLDKVYTITNKTWAHEDKAAEIIAEANKTKLGKALADIRSTAKVPSSLPLSRSGAKGELIGGKIQRVYKITPEQVADLKEQMGVLDIPQAMKETAISELDTGRLSFDTFRFLVNSNIDQTAKIIPNAISAKDISKLSPEDQTKLLKGKWERGLIGSAFNKLKSSVFRDTIKSVKDTTVPLTSIEMRAAHADILQQASGMDKKLKSTIDPIMENTSEEIRSLYGIIETGPLTADEALGYAILGTASQRASKPADFLDWAIERIFFEEKIQASFMDRFTGRKQILSNELLNKQGRKEWKAIQDDYFSRIKNNQSSPADLLLEFQEMMDKYSRLLDNTENLRFGVRPEDIIRKTKAAKEKYSEQLAIGMFYHSEGSRIVDSKIKSLTDKDVLKVSPSQIFGSDWRRINAASGGKAEQTFKDLVSDLTVQNHNNNADLEYFIRDLVSKDRAITKPLDQFGAMTAQEKARVHLHSLMVSKADEASNIILGNLKMNNSKMPTNVDNINDIVDILKQDDKLFDFIIGTETKKMLLEASEQGKIASLTQEFDSLFQRTKNQAIWRTVSGAITNVNRFFYDLLLTWRPSFHAGNTTVAPSIIYQTTGRLSGFNPRLLNKGQRIAFAADDASSRYFYEIAVIDKTGRPWTYGELSQAIQTSGVRSEYDFVTRATTDKDMVNYIKRKSKKGFGLGDGATGFIENFKDFYRVPTEAGGSLVMKEDIVFRSTVLLEALEEGKNIDSALELAKKSLFDYNDMTAWEKALSSRYFVFYAFQRQNFVNFLVALGDARKLKRYLNTFKTKRGADIIAIESNDNKQFDDRFFFEDKFSNRFILALPKEGEVAAWASKPIPALDAPLQFFNLVMDPASFAQETVTGSLRPNFKMLLSTPDKFDRTYYRLPAEFVSSAFFDNPQQVASFYESILGGSIAPRPGTEQEGAVNGYVYPLDTKQRAKLKEYLKLISITGAVSMYSDWYKIFSGEGTTYTDVPALLAPAISPMKMSDKELIEYYNLLSRQRAIEEQRDTKKKELRRLRDK